MKNILEIVGANYETESKTVPSENEVQDKDEADTDNLECQWVTNCPTKKNKYKNKSYDMYSTNTTLEGYSANTEYPSEEKAVNKVEYNNQDDRFDVIENDYGYMHSLDMDVYLEMKKYFFRKTALFGIVSFIVSLCTSLVSIKNFFACCFISKWCC